MTTGHLLYIMTTALCEATLSINEINYVRKTCLLMSATKEKQSIGWQELFLFFFFFSTLKFIKF